MAGMLLGIYLGAGQFLSLDSIISADYNIIFSRLSWWGFAGSNCDNPDLGELTFVGDADEDAKKLGDLDYISKLYGISISELDGNPLALWSSVLKTIIFLTLSSFFKRPATMGCWLIAFNKSPSQLARTLAYNYRTAKPIVWAANS